jgi:pSer/pThr/pTyr-binding forkhead associated (FHA) protein
MPQMPTITVQLVHMQGPFKGQVSEFSDFPIHIGRHASCQIRFGKEMTTISRHHARIECKGNRFRIVDVSTNGTFINGKRIADVYLRDGDVITFSENGPKASFLTKIGTGRNALSTNDVEQSSSPSSEPLSTVGADQEIQVLSTNAPLTIQFSQIRQSYTILPVTIGSDPACDVVIDDQKLSDQHVQIFFSEETYYAKDLTGKNIVKVNGRPIEKQSVLAKGAELSLTDHGPKFRFLGGGRLAEIQETDPELQEKTETTSPHHASTQKPSTLKKKKSLFKSLFK